LLGVAIFGLAALGSAAPKWAQQAYVKASNTDARDAFGWCVAVSSNTLVVGAYEEDSDATGINGDQNNNRASLSGAVYVYVRDGDTWRQEAYLKASNSSGPSFAGDPFGDGFGWALAISGDTLVVTSPQEDSSATGVNGDQNDNQAPGSGAAYVFVREGTNWSQQAYLKASNTDATDVFGVSVSISGETIVVGALDDDSRATGVNGDPFDNSITQAGAAYVFVREGTNWTQQAYLKASNTPAENNPPTSEERFGISVGVSGDTIVVGAWEEDGRATGVNGDQFNKGATSAGAAYVFTREGANWTQQAYLKASNTGAGDQFGSSVAISGDTIVVGARQEDSNATGVNGTQADNAATDSGAAYVFVREGTNWTQQAYLKASNTGPGDRFGASVAISEHTLVVGAGGFDYINGVGGAGEDSSATGVDGDQSSNGARDAGAAYVFARNGTNWTQQAYLKASNTGAGDYFGRWVAVAGPTVVVGAPGEASLAKGINGDQANNSAAQAGAAYIFGALGPELSLAPGMDGGFLLQFQGVPAMTYRVQRAKEISGPWETIATLTAPSSGLVEFHDRPPSGTGALYRTSQP
jgi:hypothetical protein